MTETAIRKSFLFLTVGSFFNIARCTNFSWYLFKWVALFCKTSSIPFNTWFYTRNICESAIQIRKEGKSSFSWAEWKWLNLDCNEGEKIVICIYVIYKYDCIILYSSNNTYRYTGLPPGLDGTCLEDLCDEGKRLSIKWKREQNRPQLLVMKVMKE